MSWRQVRVPTGFTYGVSDVTYNVREFDTYDVAKWALHKFDNPSGA